MAILRYALWIVGMLEAGVAALGGPQGPQRLVEMVRGSCKICQCMPKTTLTSVFLNA